MLDWSIDYVIRELMEPLREKGLLLMEESSDSMEVIRAGYDGTKYPHTRLFRINHVFSLMHFLCNRKKHIDKLANSAKIFDSQLQTQAILYTRVGDFLAFKMLSSCAEEYASEKEKRPKYRKMMKRINRRHKKWVRESYPHWRLTRLEKMRKQHD